MARRFESKVAVVTGAAAGIGAATVDRFACEGSAVACLDINVEGNEATATAARMHGVEAIAICFLHGYLNSTHEAALAALIRERAQHVLVSASHEISPEFREYERSMTTVINVACDHVSGLTDIGAPVSGLNCSASTPEGSARSRAHSTYWSASSSCGRLFAIAMRWSASHSVQMTHGFPGTRSMSSCSTWW